MSLKDNLPAIISFLDSLDERIDSEARLQDIYNGQLLPYVVESIQKELSPEAAKKAKERIPPINIYQRYINKASKVYMQGVSRSCDNEINQDLINHYERALKLKQKMISANKMFNINKYFALEPYINDKQQPALRVLPADQFKVWSDSTIDPTEPTVFIKYCGKLPVEVNYVDDTDSKRYNAKEENAIEMHKLFYMYTDTEFLIVTASTDKSGAYQIQQDMMEAVGNPEGINPLGRIPFVYGRADNMQLIPTVNTDDYNMAVLIPKLLSDVNYAIQYTAHSVFYGKDVELSDLNWRPDSFVTMRTIEGENKSGEIGALRPEINIDGSLKNCTTQLGLWLTAKGAKIGTIGQEYEASASGISKIVDEADMQQIIMEQAEIFKEIEYDLWNLLQLYHNMYWSQLPNESKVQFALDADITIDFPEYAPLITEAERLANMKVKKEIGIVNTRMLVSEYNPDLTEEQLDQYMEELNEDNYKEINTPVTTESNPGVEDKSTTDSEDVYQVNQGEDMEGTGQE
jgi:hypothetical protein